MNRKELKSMVVATHRKDGHAIAGERIISQARKIGKTCVVTGTSTHKLQECILKKNALCVIDRSFRLTQPPFQLRG